MRVAVSAAQYLLATAAVVNIMLTSGQLGTST
jgi:hypothetical protein